MRKRIYIGVIIVLAIICLDVLVLGNDSAKETEERRNILPDNGVIELGNHIIAYRTSSDQIHTDYKGKYIAIQDLNNREILYLPDLYKEIYEMEIEENKRVFICYGSIEDDWEQAQEVCIPVRFSQQMDMVYNVSAMENKILTEVQKDIKACIAALPKLIWEENVIYKERAYTITFERTSPAYKSLIMESGGLFADYLLTVKDEEENIISEQAIINYPIKYEEVYWAADFSKDGFTDIVFCTDYYFQKGSYTRLEFMIWNAESNVYEAKPLPVQIGWCVWNEARSSFIVFYQEEHAALGMYSFNTGNWELVGELLPVYEGEYVDENGSVLCNEWKEIFYKDGQVIEENSIIVEETDTLPWFNKESIWGRDNKENKMLYPETE